MHNHVVNVVCKFHIIMMHASEKILFEKIQYFLQLAAIFNNNLHMYATKLCLKYIMYSHYNGIVGVWE